MWLAVNSVPEGHATTGEANRRAAESWSMAHPILLDGEGKAGRSFGAKTTPHMFVIDRRGVLVYAGGHGAEGERPVDRALGELLAGEAVSQPASKPYGCSVKYAE